VPAVLEVVTDVPDNQEEDHGRKEDSCINGTGGSDGTKDKSILQDKTHPGSKYKAEGCFTKACIALSMGCDMIKVLGNKANNFFLLVMAEKDKYSTDDCIRIIKNQQSPFPWLAVLAPKNKVMVLHGIEHFLAPFKDYHPN